MIVQRTPEWYAARLGKVTSSRVRDILAVGAKGQPLKGREDYKKELVAERLTGEQANPDIYMTYEMKWGVAYENVARFQYTLITGRKVEEAGFEEHGELPTGTSPDGYIGDEGLIEIKCMKTTNHLYSCFINQEVPEEYIAQMQHQLWITGRLWCEFVAYDPRLPEGLNIFIKRVMRDEDYINMMEAELLTFFDEIDRNVGYFMGLLPELERLCQECGTVFASKTPECGACNSNLTIIKKG